MFKNKKIPIVKFISMIAIVGSPIVALASCNNQSLTDISIKVFQTSDIHGYIADTSEGDKSKFQYRLAYMANTFEQARNDKTFDDVLLLDCGDIYQGQIISNFTQGSAMRAAFDLMKYDATVLGNHEFDWGLDVNCDGKGYIKGYEIGQYANPNPQIPILAANFYEKDTNKRSSYTKDYVVVNKANKKIALIGYIPDYSGDILASWIAPYTIDEDLDKFNAKIKEINEKEKPDATIVMAHANPILLADKFDKKDVQLVAGGHDHSFRYGVSKLTGISFIQADSFAKGYSQAVIKFNKENQVSVENPSIVDIVTTNKDNLYDNDNNKNKLNKEILNLSHVSWEAIKDKVQKPIGFIEESIEKKGYINKDKSTSTTGGNWVTALMKKAMDVDIAFYNTGGIRDSFIVGPDGKKEITYGNIYTMLPFSNPLLIYELTAKQLQQHLINTFIDTNYGDQMSGLKFEYKKLYNSDHTEYEIVRMYLVNEDKETLIDINDTTTKYTICLPRYNATLKGSVTENMQPKNNEATAIVDNEAIIKALEEERGSLPASKFKIDVDLNLRAIAIN